MHHIRNVLRMRAGEQILISCGDEWEYTCRVAAVGQEEVLAEILDAQKPGKELPSRLYLFQCLPKGEKMEWIIQKSVELGVYQIIPTISRRCVVKLDQKRAAGKTARWNTVAASAAKQSKRMIQRKWRFPADFRKHWRWPSGWISGSFPMNGKTVSAEREEFWKEFRRVHPSEF